MDDPSAPNERVLSVESHDLQDLRKEVLSERGPNFGGGETFILVRCACRGIAPSLPTLVGSGGEESPNTAGHRAS